ncbi:MAG: hypothetical protein GXO33_03695, partial [Epsilonproteobacteria bacterium]|nr:hypothetical protein [Campylobacterota bacterium]
MVKIILILGLLGGLGMASDATIRQCTACHNDKAPPLSLVYRRYLLLYSAKKRVVERMRAFLIHPSKKRSAMPEGMKNRFNPQKHPAFPSEEAKKAALWLAEKEDPIRRIVMPESPKASETPA